MRRFASTDADVFVEIGPTPSLIGIGRQCLPERDALWLPSLRTGEVPGRTALREAVAALFTAGCPVDFVALHGSRGGAPIDVPLYPFERRRYSLDDVTEGTGAADQSEGS
jgi:acyl transferase domain-containing protein